MRAARELHRDGAHGPGIWEIPDRLTPVKALPSQPITSRIFLQPDCR
jgi:hypothetical protein